jgi:hypothetical protein
MAFKRFTKRELASQNGACPTCHRWQCRCAKTSRHVAKKAERAKAPKGTTIDGSGNLWCSKCDCRILQGRCTNVTCSSNH